jgi:hypothetical protein
MSPAVSAGEWDAGLLDWKDFNILNPALSKFCPDLCVLGGFAVQILLMDSGKYRKFGHSERVGDGPAASEESPLLRSEILHPYGVHANGGPAASEESPLLRSEILHPYGVHANGGPAAMTGK